MAIEFREVHAGPLRGITAVAPAGALIGVVGLKDSGVSELMRVAADVDQIRSGQVLSGPARRYVGPGDAVSAASADLLAIDYALDKYDALAKARAAVSLNRLRRTGSTILLATHDEALLERVADEVWWLSNGILAAQGDPRDALRKYRHFVATAFEAWGVTLKPRLEPTERRGDQRAEIVALELLNAYEKPTLVWRSGEDVSVRVTLKFNQPLTAPVVGILIRTRIGYEAFGTNTQLEGLPLGPFLAGQQVTLRYRFGCALCPGEYTLTVASHDPDGTPHDWMDDALAFSVTDDRSTAGIANLRASVELES
jgi:lipopolysaccharide transport system ATP-binding protein